MNIQTIFYWGIGVVVVLAIAGGAWVFMTSPTPTNVPLSAQNSGFGAGDSRTVVVTQGGENVSATVPLTTTSSQKIFKIIDGPVTTATLVQTPHPTTTLARYVLQENGHVLDIVLDNAGTVAKAVSNTTIPGTARGLWTEKGGGVLLQYLEDSITKSVYIGFPLAAPTAGSGQATTSTKQQPSRIQFLPNNITDLGISPDGKQVAYLLKTAVGSDGYTAKIDGSASKKLFSTPLAELLVSWPAPQTLLLQTKSAAGVSGAAFSVNAASGAVVPLVYASGLTAIADSTFARIVYQKITSEAASFVHDVKTNKDRPLSFNPIPEKCILSKVQASVMYCAAPLSYVAPDYLDQWHQGIASAPDAIFSFDLNTGRSSILAAPGGGDGGVSSDIAEFAVSPDDRYLVFIKKGDRSLWGVRL